MRRAIGGAVTELPPHKIAGARCSAEESEFFFSFRADTWSTISLTLTLLVRFFFLVGGGEGETNQVGDFFVTFAVWDLLKLALVGGFYYSKSHERFRFVK